MMVGKERINTKLDENNSACRVRWGNLRVLNKLVLELHSLVPEELRFVNEADDEVDAADVLMETAEYMIKLKQEANNNQARTDESSNNVIAAEEDNSSSSSSSSLSSGPGNDALMIDLRDVTTSSISSTPTSTSSNPGSSATVNTRCHSLAKEVQQVQLTSNNPVLYANEVAKPVILAPKPQSLRVAPLLNQSRKDGRPPVVFQSLTNLGQKTSNINVVQNEKISNSTCTRQKHVPLLLRTAKPVSQVTPVTSVLKPTSIVKKHSGSQSLLKIQVVTPSSKVGSNSNLNVNRTAHGSNLNGTTQLRSRSIPVISSTVSLSNSSSSTSSSADFSSKRIFVKKKRAFTVSGPRILRIDSLNGQQPNVGKVPPWEDRAHGLVCPPMCNCFLGHNDQELPDAYLQDMVVYLRENFAVLGLKSSNDQNNFSQKLTNLTIDEFLKTLAIVLGRCELFDFLRLCSKENAGDRLSRCIMLNERKSNASKIFSSYFRSNNKTKHQVHQVLFKLFRGHRGLSENSLDIVSYRDCANSGMKSDLKNYCVNPWHFERAEGVKARECDRCSDLRLAVGMRGPSCECFLCRKAIWTFKKDTKRHRYDLKDDDDNSIVDVEGFIKEEGESVLESDSDDNCYETYGDLKANEGEELLPTARKTATKNLPATEDGSEFLSLEEMDRDFDELLGSFETEILNEDAIKKENETDVTPTVPKTVEVTKRYSIAKDEDEPVSKRSRRNEAKPTIKSEPID